MQIEVTGCLTLLLLRKMGLVLTLTKEEQATIYDGFDVAKKVRITLHLPKENHKPLWKLESTMFYE